jgi:hypothetical protein
VMEDSRLARGIQLAEMVWYSVAQRVVAVAAQLYGWDEKRRAEIEELFLRPNDYSVEVEYGV